MKKIITVLLCIILTLSVVVGCSSNSSDTTSSGAASNDVNESSSKSNDKKVFQLGHLDPSTKDDAYQIFCEIFKKNLQQVSGNKLDVEIYGDARLGGERDMMEGMRLGTIDMAIITNNYYGGFVNDFKIFDAPYLFSSYDVAHEVLDDPEVMKSLKNQAYENNKVKFLAWGDSGFRYVVNNKRPVASLEEFEGLKIRLPESTVYVETFKALGANPTTMAFSEAYTAVQQGTVDGLEITASAIYTARYYQVCKYLSLTKHFYSPISINMSRPLWESLSEEEQGWVQEAADISSAEQRVQVQEVEQKLLNEMESAGIEINDVENIDEFREAVAPVYDYIRENVDESQLDLVLDKVGR